MRRSAKQQTTYDCCCIRERWQSLTKNTAYLNSAHSCSSCRRYSCAYPLVLPQSWGTTLPLPPERNGAPGTNAPGNITQPTPALVLLEVSYPGQKAGAPPAHSHHLLLALPPFPGRLPSCHPHTSPCLGVRSHLPAVLFSRSVKKPVLLPFLLL